MALSDGIQTGRFKGETDTVMNLADVLASVHDTTAIVTEDISQKYIRAGQSYVCGYVGQDVANNAQIAVLVKTGAKSIVMAYRVAGVGVTDYGIYTGATITNNGTALTVKAKNQTIVPTNTTLTYHTPTFTGGTVMIPRFLGTSASASNRIGGEALEQILILPPNTNYLIVAKNVSGQAQARMGIYVEWGEIPN